MRFIFLDDDGVPTENEMRKSIDFKNLSYLTSLSKYRCCKLHDSLLNEVVLAINLNNNGGISKFVINGEEIHSKVRLNEHEKQEIEKFLKKT